MSRESSEAMRDARAARGRPTVSAWIEAQLGEMRAKVAAAELRAQLAETAMQRTMDDWAKDGARVQDAEDRAEAAERRAQAAEAERDALDRLPALLRRIDVSRALYDHERKTMPAWELKALEDWARALAALPTETEETDRG